MEPDLLLGNHCAPFRLISMIDWFGLRPLRLCSKTLGFFFLSRTELFFQFHQEDIIWERSCFSVLFCCLFRFVNRYEFGSTHKKRGFFFLFSYRE